MTFNNTNNNLYGGKPNEKYAEFFFQEFAHYTNIVRENDEVKINIATIALITICPDTQIRERLFKKYTEEKNKLGVITASAELAGDFMSYISETLEFTEKSYASVF